MAKTRNIAVPGIAAVRSRRAYFDCRFGQLHVRTAFPTTGGFDEQVTLFCLHDDGSSSRAFASFLPQIAANRSVYAPDLPGWGESDPAPERTFAASAAAVADLAADLRLREIDLLGVRQGAGAALRLAATRPDLVRRLVLFAIPPVEDLPVAAQPSLVLQVQLGRSGASPWVESIVPNARYKDLADFAADPFENEPAALARHVGAFLDERR